MQEGVVLPEHCGFGVVGDHTKDLIKESTVLFKRVLHGGALGPSVPPLIAPSSAVDAMFLQVCLQRAPYACLDAQAFCPRAVCDITGLAAGVLMLLAGQEPREETSSVCIQGDNSRRRFMGFAEGPSRIRLLMPRHIFNIAASSWFSPSRFHPPCFLIAMEEGHWKTLPFRRDHLFFFFIDISIQLPNVL